MESPSQWLGGLPCLVLLNMEKKPKKLICLPKLWFLATELVSQSECLAPCLSEGRVANCTTLDNPSPPTSSSAVRSCGWHCSRQHKGNQLCQATPLYLVLLRYGNSLTRWFLKTPYFKPPALEQLSTFKDPDAGTSLLWRQNWGALVTQMWRFSAEVEVTTSGSAQNQEVPKNWTHSHIQV